MKITTHTQSTILLYLIFGMMQGVFAFEVTTHAKITQNAWSRFITIDPSVLSRMGIRDSADAFKTKNYYDYRPASGEAPLLRTSNSNRPYGEEQIIERKPISVLGAPPVSPFGVVGWLMRGVIREDDDINTDDPSPKDDPRGDFHRVFSHFHDPVNGNGLKGSGVTLGPTAADWALKSDALAPAFTAIPPLGVLGTPARYNNFNLVSFRESQWIALTGLDKAGTKVAFNEEQRGIHWATSFRSMGDILHLNQDMAAPQHTRNDGHAGAFPSAVSGHKSVFERYADARIKGDFAFSNKDDNTSVGNIKINPLPIDFGSYPVPLFAKYADYWASSDKKGLADYSNKGFFTIGTLPNLPSNTYASPSKTISSYAREDVAITRWNGQAVSSWLPKSTVYKASVPDGYQPQLAAANVPHFARSIWEDARQGLVAPINTDLITLTKSSYDAAIDLLVPRAIAYSAGILQYAFRGQLEITPPAEGIYSLADHFDFSGAGQPVTAPVAGFKGFKTIKLKLRNATPDIGSSPQIMPGGTLVAVMKFYRNTKHTDDLANELANTADYLANRSTVEEIVVSSRVKDAGGSTLANPIPITNTAQTFTFEFDQELPINATDVKLQVVYRGVLGSEADAVVVETVDISEPTFLSYLNASDYIHIGNGLYTRDQINAATPAGAALRSQIQPPSCIDGMTNQLANGCFQPFGVNFAMKFGTATNTAVAGFTVPANKNFNRLGTLIPAGANVVMNLAANSSPCGAAATKVSPGATVQTDYELQGDGTTIPRITTSQVKYNVRGIRTHFVAVCTHNGDGVPHTEDLTQAQVMQLAIPADAKPLKLSSFNYGAP